MTNGTVLLEAFLSGCVRENTYFYVFLTLLGEMVRCFVEHIFFTMGCALGNRVVIVFFRYPIVTPLCYLLDLL